MPKISRDEAVAALVEVIHETLVRGEEVHVPELGTFGVRYCPSETVEQPDGSVLLKPPRNEVTFTPDA